MVRPFELRAGRALPRMVGALMALAVVVTAAPALGQQTLTVTGTLVIDGGGTNANSVRYAAVTVAPGAQVTTIRLSPQFPTLVVRGPKGFGEPCNVGGECWDSTVCAAKVAGATGVCGWSGTELPAGCSGNMAALGAPLDDCADLWRTEQRDGAAPNAVARTQSCLTAGAQFATLAMSCPAVPYRSTFEAIAFDVLTFSQTQLQATAPDSRFVVADLAPHLKLIGDWYTVSRRFHPASQGAAANDLVWSKTSQALGTFWQNVYARAGVPAPGSANPSDALLDTLFQRTLDADRLVLDAALTEPLPIRTAPLVQVMGDALESMSGRLGQVGLYHDLACRFRDNPAALQARCANDGVKTEISELFRLLASAADPAALSGALVRPPPATVTASWAPWRATFARLSAIQAAASPAFQAAVLDALPGVATYSPDLIAPPPPPTTPGTPPPPAPRVTPPLMGLATILQDARMRANSYALTGLFGSRYDGILRAGMQEARVNEVISRVDARTLDLRTEVTNYRTTRLQQANAILAEMVNLATQQNVSDQITQRRQRELQLRQDLAGLRTTIEVQEARYADFMQAYNTVALIVADKPGTDIVHDTANVSVTAGDVRWQATTEKPRATDPLAWIVSTPSGTTSGGAPVAWPIVAAKGDILNLNTSGTWSPSCALRTSTFTNPLTGQPDAYVVPTPALTGPEGYLLTLSGSSFTAATNQSVHSVERYTNEGTSRKYCGGVGASIGGSIPVGPISIGLSAHGSADWCRFRDSGTKTSDVTSQSSTEGSESRMGASFATGIRLESTPFPTFPAGSLLAVLVGRNGTSRADIRDVQVVQKPYSSLVIKEDVDVYLVVNDVADAACGAADPSALTVSLNQIRPFGAMAQQLGSGMADALRHLRDEQELLVEQGRVGPQQMAELRDQAYVDLILACGASCTQLSYYPPEVLRFFDAWVSKELAAIERRVDARTTERELTMVELQHAALAHDLANLGAQARLLRLMPTWLLKDLGTYVMERKTQSLLDLVVADLFPIVDLRQPGTLQALDANMLNALLGNRVIIDPQPLDWTGNLADWSSAAARAAENIVARLRDALANRPPLNDRILAVGIPRPGGLGPPPGRWQRISGERARAVWDAIDNRDPFASISVEPTDLYAMYPWSTDVMLCNEAEPVITAMAIYMVRPIEGGPDFPGLYVPVSVDRNQLFPGVGQLKSYRIDNDDWLSQGVRVTAGQPYELETRVAALMSDAATPLYRVGNGLSPFTKFDVSLGGISTAPSYPAPADDAIELVLVFRAQTRNVASIGQPPMCAL